MPRHSYRRSISKPFLPLARALALPKPERGISSASLAAHSRSDDPSDPKASSPASSFPPPTSKSGSVDEKAFQSPSTKKGHSPKQQGISSRDIHSTAQKHSNEGDKPEQASHTQPRAGNDQSMQYRYQRKPATLSPIQPPKTPTASSSSSAAPRIISASGSKPATPGGSTKKGTLTPEEWPLAGRALPEQGNPAEKQAKRGIARELDYMPAPSITRDGTATRTAPAQTQHPASRRLPLRPSTCSGLTSTFTTAPSSVTSSEQAVVPAGRRRSTSASALSATMPSGGSSHRLSTILESATGEDAHSVRAASLTKQSMKGSLSCACPQGTAVTECEANTLGGLDAKVEEKKGTHRRDDEEWQLLTVKLRPRALIQDNDKSKEKSSIYGMHLPRSKSRRKRKEDDARPATAPPSSAPLIALPAPFGLPSFLLSHHSPQFDDSLHAFPSKKAGEKATAPSPSCSPVGHTGTATRRISIELPRSPTAVEVWSAQAQNAIAQAGAVLPSPSPSVADMLTKREGMDAKYSLRQATADDSGVGLLYAECHDDFCTDAGTDGDESVRSSLDSHYTHLSSTLSLPLPLKSSSSSGSSALEPLVQAQPCYKHYRQASCPEVALLSPSCSYAYLASFSNHSLRTVAEYSEDEQSRQGCSSPSIASRGSCSSTHTAGSVVRARTPRARGHTVSTDCSTKTTISRCASSFTSASCSATPPRPTSVPGPPYKSALRTAAKSGHKFRSNEGSQGSRTEERPRRMRHVTFSTYAYSPQRSDARNALQLAPRDLNTDLHIKPWMVTLPQKKLAEIGVGVRDWDKDRYESWVDEEGQEIRLGRVRCSRMCTARSCADCLENSTAVAPLT